RDGLETRASEAAPRRRSAASLLHTRRIGACLIGPAMVKAPKTGRRTAPVRLTCPRVRPIILLLVHPRGVLRWSAVPERAVGPHLVVVDPPSLDLDTRIREVDEPSRSSTRHRHRTLPELRRRFEDPKPSGPADPRPATCAGASSRSIADDLRSRKPPANASRRRRSL